MAVPWKMQNLMLQHSLGYFSALLMTRAILVVVDLD